MRIAKEVRACQLCSPGLDPRPVIQVHQKSRVLVVGQAPGRRVHETGIPFNDPSGDRLRSWLGVDRTAFYDPERFALLPMAFCFPGSGRGGDLPPPPACAKAWRSKLLAELPGIRLTVALGRYAIDWHTGDRRPLGEVVRDWRRWAPDVFVLPHPSPRNNRWIRERPWLEDELVPALRTRLAEVLS